MRGGSELESKQLLLYDMIKNRESSKQLCLTCTVKRPLRSKHCSVCDVCVAKFDHHCPWISACIGFRNHKYFVYYLLFMYICIMWFVCLVYQKLIWEFQSRSTNNFDLVVEPSWKEFFSHSFAVSPFLLNYGIFAFSYSFWALTVLYYQIKQIAINLTTNEAANYDHYVYLQKVRPASPEELKQINSDGLLSSTVAEATKSIQSATRPVEVIEFYNPFDEGVFRNVASFLGIFSTPTSRMSWETVYEVPQHLRPRPTSEELSIRTM